MNASSMCVSCIISKQEKLIRQSSDEARKSEYMHRILEIFYLHGQTESAPWIAEQINLLYKDFWGQAEDFTDQKQRYNQLLLAMESIVPCIGNGNAAPGMVIKRLNQEARQTLFAADVIISKGQGNFESLYGEGLNPYYLFLCKCDLFVRRFGLAQYESVFAREERIKDVGLVAALRTG